MNDAREEFIGTAWVALGGLLTFLLPAWVLLTAVTIQLSPELSGFDLLHEGAAELPADRPLGAVWVRGAVRAALGLAIVAPALGLVVAGAALARRGTAVRVERERVRLDALVQDDAVLQGVQLVTHTEAASPVAVEESDGVLLADPMRRIVAVAIDGMLLALVYAVPLLVIVPFVDLGDPELPAVAYVAAAASLVGVVALVVVQLMGLVRRGQTLGKRWLRLRITRPDGSHADAGRVLGMRTFAWSLLLQVPVLGWFVLPAADLVYLMAGERHRTLHDRLADTVVIDVRAEGPPTA